MAPQISEHRIRRFGLYEADLDSGTLKRHGIPVKLQEQPFRILTFLLERPGNIISREELCTRLWPEGTYVEFDGSLNTALMKLRAVLNDDPENPRFVETVPKKGYRFIAPVHFHEPALLSEALDTENEQGLAAEPAELPLAGSDLRTATPPADLPKSQRFRLFRLVLLLAATMVAAALVWRYWPTQEPQVVRVTQLTHTGRVAPGSQIVSDGARLYFVSRESGQWTLMTTSIHGGSVEKLPSPFGNTIIFDLSPDRTQLLIGPFVHEDDQIPLWIWPAHGGVPHRLGDVTASDAAWSPIGDLIAFTQGDRLLTVRRDGTAAVVIHRFTGRPHSPVWSEDGKWIRFTVTDSDKSTDEMWEIGIEGKGLRRVLLNANTDLHDTTGAWGSDDRYFLFTAGSDSHLGQIIDSASNVWASRESGGIFSPRRTSTELTHGPVAFRSVTGTDDSNRFFALGTHPEYQLIRMNPRTGQNDVVLPDAGATDVDVTADGEWLVYSLRENGALWKSRRTGKERIELTASTPGALAPQWSPDGNEVLFTGFFLAKRPQLYLVPSNGGIPRALLHDLSKGSTRSGDWSSDGKLILFDYFEGDRSDLRIAERDSGKMETLPDSQGLIQPRWSPDGKFIAAINSKTHDILLYSLATKKWSLLAESTNVQGMRWSADSNYVYYQEMADTEQSIYRVRLGRALPEKVVGFKDYLGSLASQCHFTGVAPDGSIYATVDRGGTDIYALDLKLP
ncbi:MAG TPA: winged helix-turn-helix domain-containing protein [Candidatus Eisenbacteria bacterium]|jgi:Tol biopolymer transport system component/DNA-binding winged helix-turn-helix (wHTH) protein|nr:winged helix-turn-helix domain-containing protein [Candidatus Eisenbacteria bacterium]